VTAREAVTDRERVLGSVLCTEIEKSKEKLKGRRKSQGNLGVILFKQSLRINEGIRET
jgi:hypothetical protein